jgi:hypothetical protein
MTVTLPILRVKTRHSEYLIDQNAGTVSRRPVHEDANRNLADYVDEHTPYEEISLDSAWYPGSLMVTYPNGTYSVSTEIESVEELS